MVVRPKAQPGSAAGNPRSTAVHCAKNLGMSMTSLRARVSGAAKKALIASLSFIVVVMAILYVAGPGRPVLTMRVTSQALTAASYNVPAIKRPGFKQPGSKRPAPEVLYGSVHTAAKEKLAGGSVVLRRTGTLSAAPQYRTRSVRTKDRWAGPYQRSLAMQPRKERVSRDIGALRVDVRFGPKGVFRHLAHLAGGTYSVVVIAKFGRRSYSCRSKVGIRPGRAYDISVDLKATGAFTMFPVTSY